MCRFNAKYNLDFEKIRQLLVTKNKTKIVSEKRFHKTIVGVSLQPSAMTVSQL